MPFFTADLHFGHRGVLRHCRRPYESLEEMEQSLISNWNDTITEQDTIYILGDFSFSGLAKTLSVLERLNGRKHWITGNHDKALMKKEAMQEHFESIGPYKEIKLQLPDGNQDVVMSHYPMLTWNKAHYGSWMLHGHSHGTLKHPYSGMRLLDVGVDTNDLRPYSVQQIAEYMQGRKYNEVDHHETKESDNEY